MMARGPLQFAHAEYILQARQNTQHHEEDRVGLTLKARPDEMGCLVGTTYGGQRAHAVVILPPKAEVAHWRAHRGFGLSEAHATLWMVYIDNEEVAQVSCLAAAKSIVEQWCRAPRLTRP